MTAYNMLIISFSPIASDARVLKQVREFAGAFHVTTCGFGPSPDARVEHIQLDEARPGRFRRFLDEALVRAGWYRAAYWTGPTVRAARSALSNRHFDIVIANDLDTAGVAVSLFGSGAVHCDLHEYWPHLHGENARWMAHRSKLYVWLLRTYVRPAASATTVSSRIADEYRRVHGIETAVVTNASPGRELAPSAASRPLRLVYSGAGDGERGLESLVEAVSRTTTDVTLDLYLVSARPDYLTGLSTLIEKLGAPARICAPVSYNELVPTLNTYDVGVYQPKPINLNHAYALPNKVFDFVQARLALVIGPAEEMARVVREHGLGVVTDDFSTESLTRALDALTVDDVRRYKAASDRAASDLSAEKQQEGWKRAVRDVVGARS